MTDLSEIAVAVPVLSRSEALAQFLESVPAGVSRVVIADNGPPGAHTHVYSRDWHVDIDVLDLEFDIGIGACRAALTDAVGEPYLWMGDCDMAFCRTEDLQLLRDILAAHDDLGGVSGWLIEDGTVRPGAANLRVTDSAVIVGQGSEPEIVDDPLPHARFEYLPQAALFRSAVFDTYDYDPGRRHTEHTDFFLGQRAAGDWSFASTPVIQIHHHKHQDSAHRERRAEQHQSDDGMAAKWGVDRRVPGTPPRWDERSLPERAFDVFRQATPARVWLPVRQTLKRVGVA